MGGGMAVVSRGHPLRPSHGPSRIEHHATMEPEGRFLDPPAGLGLGGRSADHARAGPPCARRRRRLRHPRAVRFLYPPDRVSDPRELPRRRVRPGAPIAGERAEGEPRSRGIWLDTERIRSIAEAWRIWRREPERSRRVLRLAFANWLAHRADAPRPTPGEGSEGRRPPRLLRLRPRGAGESPRHLAEGPRPLAAEHPRRPVAPGPVQPPGDPSPRSRQPRALVVFLASELYRRDHKAEPPSDEALVGPYLKELPDDGPGNQPRPE